MRRAHVLLAGGVALAGLAAARSGVGGAGHPALVASVTGAPIGAPIAEPAAPLITTPGTPPPPAAPLGALAHRVATVTAGDAGLAGQVDLDHVTRVGDHYEAPLPGGRHAILTLDPELQPLAEQLLDEARAPRGAIVAMAPDGRILALAGRRTAATKGGPDGTADWRLATDVWAPAASVFKLVTATALVSNGVAPDDKVCFHGGVRSVVESNLRDDKHDGPCESLSFGVAHSQNAILGKLAYQHLEPPALLEAAHALGVDGALPASALPGTAGEVTIAAHRDLAFAQGAAGFSGSRLSVAGGALLAATFADRGEQPTPVLVEAIVDDAGRHEVVVPARRRVLSAEVARAVGKMMVGTCEFGSAARSFRRGKDAVQVAGKTGTLSATAPFYMQYSWFVGFAPADHPKVIVSVLLGNPENWHLKGHSAARRLIDLAVGQGAPQGPGPHGHQRAPDHTSARDPRRTRVQW
jgi:cell division protein FtsI/penicillin-binding protein 2